MTNPANWCTLTHTHTSLVSDLLPDHNHYTVTFRYLGPFLCPPSVWHLPVFFLLIVDTLVKPQVILQSSNSQRCRTESFCLLLLITSRVLSSVWVLHQSSFLFQGAFSFLFSVFFFPLREEMLNMRWKVAALETASETHLTLRRGSGSWRIPQHLLKS